MQISPVDARTLIQIGVEALRRGDPRKARESFESKDPSIASTAKSRPERSKSAMPNASRVAMRTFLCFAVALFVAGSAHADATRDALSEMTKCADITEPSERLKCFDVAVTRAKSALAAPEQEPSKKSLLEWFGFSRPKTVTKPEDFGKPPAPPAPGQEITEITATVLEYARTVRGKSVFILENGQVWRQLDADRTELPDPTPGTAMKVTIETGALGSYNLTVEGSNRTIKVTRLK